MEKDGLPLYSEAVGSWSPPRPRKFKLLKLVAFLSILYFLYSVGLNASAGQQQLNSLSLERLQEDQAVCAALRRIPKDPTGSRERNERYINGTKPVVIRNAKVWTGEPATGTSEEDARAGKGYAWIEADVLMEFGMITKVQSSISDNELPRECGIYDAKGRMLTAGIVDMHSHAGVDSLPGLNGNSDTNELSSDVTPYVRSIDGFDPLDPQIQWIKSGGVTTSLVLPGSGNNIGGEAFVFKFAVGKPNGRLEISQNDMLADPEKNWRYIKMACGENAKNVYGKVGERGPFSRLGEAWEFRHAFEQARNYVKSQDDWCNTADSVGLEHMGSYLPQDLKWETLGAVLRGQVHVNTHCYTVADLEAFIRHTNEFKFPVRAFHHAHQTYLVPEILKRVYGGRPPAAAIFADNMYYKAEAYRASEQTGKILYENGITPVYVSDDPVLNAQHVVFEAAKGYGYGLAYHAALAGVTSAPADLLGLGERIGKIKSGFDADVVVWDSDPLSVGAAPVQVWIDGTPQFSNPYILKKPAPKPMISEPIPVGCKDEGELHNSVVFTGVSKILLPGYSERAFEFGANVVVKDSKITCVGACASEMEMTASGRVVKVQLNKGYITLPFTAFGSFIGLSEIDAEGTTQNGPNPDTVFSRAIDGLALDSKQLADSYRHGVTRAISAPNDGRNSHHGVSVGFLTGAKTALKKHAVFMDEAAVHYPLGLAAKHGKTPSISSAVGALRSGLLKAITNDNVTDEYSEAAYLQKVIKAEMPLALTTHSADTIAAILRLKEDVESVMSSRAQKHKSKIEKLRIIIVGGAESHLVAKELAAASVPVLLAPLQTYSLTWEQRRSLTGAPLTNGTTIDVLLDAGVLTAIGVNENWEVRDLNLMAGVAYKNGGGRLNEREAVALISENIDKMLGLPRKSVALGGQSEFVVFEGSPLEVGSKVRAIADGAGEVAVF
jgi:imidazolonepropionase-like amidohydrolase